MQENGGSGRTPIAMVALAVAVGLMVALGLAEVLTRIFVPDPGFVFENRPSLFVPNPITGYRNRPSYHAYAQGTIRVRTNSLGHRGKEIIVKKPKGTFRILGLGDSVMWGTGIDEERIFLSLLQSKLQKESRGKRHLEVVNEAVIGYSLHQELLTLEHYGVAMSPDIVILGFVMNDAYPTEDPFFNVHTFHAPRKLKVGRTTYKEEPPPRFYLYRLTRTMARRTRDWWISSGNPSVPQNPWAPESFEVKSWPVLQRHFHRLQEISNKAGSRLLVILFPTRTALRWVDGRMFPQSLLSDWMDSAGIACLDLNDTLGGLDDVFLDEMHLSSKGHSLVADRILKYLRVKNWLPG